jgi:flavodoxin
VAQVSFKTSGVIVWASRTGKTQLVCERVAEVLTSEGLSVETVHVSSFHDALLSRPFLIVASPTYGSGDLHPDWDQLERSWRDADFHGLPAAVLGCGSLRYPQPFGAVEILETRLKNQGANLLLPACKMDTLTGLRVRDCDPWAHELAQILRQIETGD